MGEFAISRTRGDTAPDKFKLVENGVAVDISVGYSFRMTVSSEKNPDAVSIITSKLYHVDAVITGGPAGEYEFRPSSSNTDLLGKKFYDIEMTYGGGFKKTIRKDEYVFTQDITK